MCQEGAETVAVPRTGQALCYSSAGTVIDCAGTGQDGHIQAGVAWPSPRFTDNLDGSLTDNLTGLVWLEDANCISTQYPGFDGDGSPSDGLVSWQHALDFVRGINDGSYPNCGAGRTGWRLPNINEIESLMNAGERQPLTWLAGQGFQNMLTNYYWSSTTNTYGNHQAWVLDFYSGNPYRTVAGKYANQVYPVWPVRGTTAAPARIPKTGQVKCYRSADPWGEIPCAGTGQDGELQAGAAWPLPRFIENSDGTITDNLTGLMWLKDANCFGQPTWQVALDFVSDFNANPGNHNCEYYSAIYDDWRLANSNELESLFNAAETNHALWLSGEGYLFSNVQASWYWSSTSRVDNMSTAAWVFFMIGGVVEPSGKNYTGSYIWPVRTAPPKFILTIAKDGPGSGTVTSDNQQGIDCGADCIEPYEDGTSITLAAAPDAGFAFAGWAGDPDCDDGIVTMNAHKTCRATFVMETHTIAVTKDGTGGGTVLIGGPGGPVVCGNDCQETYPAGTGIVLDVVPFADSEFAGWSGDPDCADGQVLMDADKTCVATFDLRSYRLVIGKPGAGSGTVASTNVAGINCGDDCSELYPVGTRIALQATPDPWNIFAWGGDPDCDDGEVTIADADVTCFAVFSVPNHTLTVTKDGSGSGAVLTSEPGGIDCGPNCSAADKTYPAGTEVTLRAGTAVPWLFLGWGGDPDCDDGVVTMSADRICTATFTFLEDLQFQQMQQLRNESQRTPEFRFEAGIPRYIGMRVPMPAALPDDPVLQALDFLERYKHLYRIDAPKDLYLQRIKTNQFHQVGGGNPEPAERHLFFGQQKDGIPVHGATLVVHMRGNTITGTNGNYLADIPDFTLPAVQAPAAEAIALADVRGTGKEVIGVTKLFYFNGGLTANGGGTPDPSNITRLVWRVIVRGLRSSDGAGTSWRLFVDAQDGTVLSKIDEMRTNGANKDFDIETANNSTSSTCWDGLITEDDEWFDEDGESNYPGAGHDPFRDGRNAYDFARLTYDFYFDNFHHHSWNNGQGGVCDFFGIFGCPGEAQVEVMVHVGNNWDNAAYSPVCDHLEFGDGYMSNDIFAHEYTHAVTRWSAGLEYENQSGAMNESFSDVMAAMLDDDWLEGEDSPARGEDGSAGGLEDGGVGDDVRESGDDCGNGADDDGDDFVDEGCPETAAQCGNGIDDEADGIDDIDEGCPETGAHCGDLVDNDGDGAADEGCPGSCQDGIDNGGDGEADSADTRCFMRDLANPSRKGDPDHLNANKSGDGYGIRVLPAGTAVNCDQDDDNYNDCGWVHTNSGILNKAAYLLTMGGVHTGSGIEVRGLGGLGGDGREKARRLFYDVLTTRLFPTAFFIDLRDEMVEQAAAYVVDNEHGFWDQDVCSVMNALAAVGLGVSDIDCDGTPDHRDGDNDDDGIRDDDDNCPGAANIRQEDADGDGTGDRCDPDGDGDGIDNVVDNCPTAANDDQDDADVDGTGDACEDDDLDGVFNPVDKCPDTPDPGQADNDNDDIGNACDDDRDNDGIDNESDNCPNRYNFTQDNNDTDEYGDSCDNCDSADNPDQRDMDNDNVGDACDDDIDGDGTPNADDPCPINPLPVLLLGGSEVLPCQPNDDLALLLSGNFGEFVHGNLWFPSLTDSIKIPVFPCIDDGCPDWIDESYQTGVEMSLPVNFQARIVDDKGFVVTKDAAGLETSMRFMPEADSFFRFQGAASGGGALSAAHSTSGVRQAAPLSAYKGQSYFLEIYPSADVVPGQRYAFAIRVRSGCTQTWFQDGDDDGYSNGFSTESCEKPVGFKTAPELIATAGDCDDLHATVNPGAAEVANNGVDDDCDPATPSALVKGRGINVPGAPHYAAALSVKVNEQSLEKNRLSYSYPRKRLNFVSTSITGVSASGKMATITGTGTVNGVRKHTFTATISDGSPDAMGIEIRRPNGSLRYSAVHQAVRAGDFIVVGE